ncbi:MAG TPA: ribosome-associated translation inhibitor RaiA [Anaerolineae bacterium]|nr:ribosome-associated translation inhibitor RaiA [Anaerolineae bacterium]
MTIEINIFTKNLGLTDDIRKKLTNKATKLNRFLKQIDEARIDLTYTKSARDADDRYVAQITLHGRGFILRAEERAENIRSAIDQVIDKIHRQIERYKGKRFRSKADFKPAREILIKKMAEKGKKDDTPLIARRKHFTLSPMDELEAIEQMNLLGHEDFFIFYNANSNNINVLYKRRDGTYGLIEPELG